MANHSEVTYNRTYVVRRHAVIILIVSVNAETIQKPSGLDEKNI